MPWFKVDDRFFIHPKAVEAGNAALGLWVRAGSWSAAFLTDGALPAHMLGTLGAQRRDAERLVKAQLWEHTEGGYRFLDWEDYQPTKAQVERDRKSNKARQSRWRKRMSNDGDNAVTDAVTDAVSVAAPTRPDPSSSKEEEELLSQVAPRPDVEKLCEHLHRKITEHGSKTKITEEWRNSARLMLDRDGRDPDEAHALIDWCQNDDFWHRNILGMPKFRKQYDQLRLKAGSALGRAQAGLPMYDVSRLPERGMGWNAGQLDMVLGKDTWTVPEPPADMNDDDGWRWQQQEQRRHRALRHRAAERAVGWETA